MNKGDLRRQQILTEAEKLFCQKGYEETSVQDLLDQLKLSKGGFYHHFESKQELLEELCRQGEERAVEKAKAAIEKSGDNFSAALEGILSQAGPWREETPQGMMMLLSDVGLSKGDGMLNRLRESRIHQGLAPLLQEVIRQGCGQEIFFLPHGEMAATLILNMCQWLGLEMAKALTGDKEEAAGQMLGYVQLTRHAIERLLSAPYGSIRICELQKIKNAVLMAQGGARRG